VRIGIRSLGVSMGLNLLVVLPLAFAYPGRPGLHALLALNTGIGAWYNSSMLYRGLRRQGVLHHAVGWRRMLWQVLAANVVMVAFLWWVAGDTQRWIEMGAWSRAQWMTLARGRGARGSILARCMCLVCACTRSGFANRTAARAR